MSDSMKNNTTRWAIGLILVVVLGAIGWVFGLSRPSAEMIEKSENRITTLERRADVVDSTYDRIIERLMRIEKKLDEMK